MPVPQDNETYTPPSLRWRVASRATIAAIGLACKAFLKVGTKSTETHGLDNFVKLLDERQDISQRERGLLTVSNHTSVLDDPLIWGFLPLRFFFNPTQMRWSLGSYDICFQGSALTTFFNLGQVLPTHRQTYSDQGGLFQPTVPQCIRLLSKGPFIKPTPPHPNWASEAEKEASEPDSSVDNLSDPFTDPIHTYTTTGSDVFPAPSSYSTRKHSWVHIFPEGKVHQHPDHSMRYFKWGVARMILEADVCPKVVPIFIAGPEEIMHEARPAPRWLPRFGKKVNVTFGEPVAQVIWDAFRERWKKLRDKEAAKSGSPLPTEQNGDGTLSEELMYGKEAVALRLEVVAVVRGEVLKLRKARGYPDEDPKSGLVETWRAEGGKVEGKMDDGSWTKVT
ncbi:Lysophosphatidylcholine acyltransferase [Venturia nashicola]|uniref:Tafazzin family protein n=1 Tax=Venturia nashicola TaxID=86259 RepID=A0A4Z1P357_9PEZI|nr:Lysophosphatidylcholine acyltransferase [Venturia nashicola]TLD21576.1 Lysophosphatidylcholine acyltransferase [Venturia nashicola]